MTSKEHITQLVDEAVAKRRELTLRKNDDPQKDNCHTRKWFTKKQFQNWRYSFVIIKTLLQVSRFEVSFYSLCYCYFSTLSRIQLLKQTWSPLVRKGSQTRGFSAN